MAVKSKVFQNCCAIQEIGNFGGEYDYFNTLDVNKLKKQIQNKINDAKRNNRGIVVATLNHRQKNKIEPLLIAEGFEQTVGIKSPLSGNRVYLYIKTLVTPLAKPRAKAPAKVRRTTKRLRA